MKPLLIFAAASQLMACSTPLSPQQRAAVDAGAATANLAITYFQDHGKVSAENAALARATVGIAQKAVEAGAVGAVVVVPSGK